MGQALTDAWHSRDRAARRQHRFELPRHRVPADGVNHLATPLPIVRGPNRHEQRRRTPEPQPGRRVIRRLVNAQHAGSLGLKRRISRKVFGRVAHSAASRR